MSTDVLPIITCEPWPTDFSCCPGWEDIPIERRTQAIARATEILNSLTGDQFGICQRTVRPCSDHRGCPLPAELSRVGPYIDPYPFIVDGKWHNCGCVGAPGCDCTPPCSARLDPGPVQQILSVKINGVVLPPVDPTTGRPNYVVYDWRYLVRTDGCCWPDCQDWNQAPQPPDPQGNPVTCGVWEVTYTYGYPVPAGGIFAVSELACELAKKACGVGPCRLPAGATQVTRDGITIELDPTKWINHLPDVASWVHTVNPGGLLTPPKILLPKRHPRVQTWPGATP